MDIFNTIKTNVENDRDVNVLIVCVTADFIYIKTDHISMPWEAMNGEEWRPTKYPPSYGACWVWKNGKPYYHGDVKDYIRDGREW